MWRISRNGGVQDSRRQTGQASLWVLAVLGALGGGMVLYWYGTPQAAPSWVRGWLPGLPEYSRPLYRWRDAQGHEQITDQPPKDRPYATVQYRGDANVTPLGAKPPQ